MSVTTEVPALLALDPVAQDLLFRDARTANTFTDEPVTEEQLQAIYDLAKWAPTAMNSQPLRLVAVRSKEARERLVGYMAEGNRAKTATAPLTVILAADVDFHEHLPRVFLHAPGLKDNFTDEQAQTMDELSQRAYSPEAKRSNSNSPSGASSKVAPCWRHRKRLSA